MVLTLHADGAATNTNESRAGWRILCSSWDAATQAWQLDPDDGGGSWQGSGAVRCEARHLTEFGAFWGPPPRFNRMSC